MDSLENALASFGGCLERLSTGEEKYTPEFLLNKFRELQNLYAQADLGAKASFRGDYEEAAGELYLVLKDHFGYKKKTFLPKSGLFWGLFFIVVNKSPPPNFLSGGNLLLS